MTAIAPPDFIKPRTVLDLREDEIYAMLDEIRAKRLVAERGTKRRNATADAEPRATEKKRIIREFNLFCKEVDKLEVLYDKMVARWQVVLGLRMSIGDDVLAEIEEMQNAKSTSAKSDGASDGAGSTIAVQTDGA